MTTKEKEHFKFAPGDQIQDLTFDPPMNGVVVAKHDKPNAYYVRLANASNDVVIHARNLRFA
jgi:hypothetical protein